MFPTFRLVPEWISGLEMGESGDHEEFAEYRVLVGSLMWMSAMTIPDITNALGACARHCHNPTARHWKALLQIAAHVTATKEIG